MQDTDDDTELDHSLDVELDDEEEIDETQSDEETEDATEGGRDGPDVEETDEEDVGETKETRGNVLAGGRRERAILKAREEKRAEKERAERAERELLELKAQVQELRNPRVDPELERQRRELMTPEERMQSYQADIDRKLQVIEFKNYDTSDKASYVATAAVSPVHAKYANQVEKILHEERLQGRNHPREFILKQLLGDALLKRSATAGATARKKGASNIKKQTTRPSNSKSNVSRSRREQTLEEKLDGVYI